MTKIFEKVIKLNKSKSKSTRGVRKFRVVLTDKEVDYTQIGCFRVIAATIANCFVLPSGGQKYLEKRKTVLNFAKKSPLIELFCDCSDNFEAQRLRKLIIKKNSPIIKRFTKYANRNKNKKRK
jgi:hypothetical protein